MTPADARHRLYLISYALDELGLVTEEATETTLSSTLGILSKAMEDCLAVIHPFVPDPVRRDD
jgi:hypothetical protein